MIVRSTDRVVVQGMTGKQGSFWTEKMLGYGTRVVGGVNPKRAGELHGGVPVFASVREAAAKTGGLDVAVMFIPPGAALAAAEDAIGAGVKLLVVLTEHIPSRDVMRMHALAGAAGCRIVGPNTAGLVTPGEAFVGIMPAFNPRIFRPGNVGVISRSGSLGTLICLNLLDAGRGQSAFIGIGGDPMLGTTVTDALQELDKDEKTNAIVLVGEIGGTMEEDAAATIKAMRKPVVSFIAGRSAPPDRRMGHAGAIVTGNRGSGQSKVDALTRAGVAVIDVPSQEAPALQGFSVMPTGARVKT